MRTSVGGSRRQQLLQSHKDPQIKTRVTALLAQFETTSRQEVIDRYQSALTMAGDVERGRALFRRTCAACHKLEGVGNQFGPELTQLDPKWQAADLLKEMLEPSAKINEKFQTTVFQLDSGKTVSGLIVEETPTAYKVIENPLAKAEPIEIAKDEVVAQKKSPISLMPKGLLDKLTREEILDLVAYIVAKGDKSHSLYSAGGGHHGGHGH